LCTDWFLSTRWRISDVFQYNIQSMKTQNFVTWNRTCVIKTLYFWKQKCGYIYIIQQFVYYIQGICYFISTPTWFIFEALECENLKTVAHLGSYHRREYIGTVPPNISRFSWSVIVDNFLSGFPYKSTTVFSRSIYSRSSTDSGFVNAKRWSTVEKSKNIHEHHSEQHDGCIILFYVLYVHKLILLRYVLLCIRWIVGGFLFLSHIKNIIIVVELFTNILDIYWWTANVSLSVSFYVNSVDLLRSKEAMQ
jgi:hypothetical protein